MNKKIVSVILTSVLCFSYCQNFSEIKAINETINTNNYTGISRDNAVNLLNNNSIPTITDVEIKQLGNEVVSPNNVEFEFSVSLVGENTNSPQLPPFEGNKLSLNMNTRQVRINLCNELSTHLNEGLNPNLRNRVLDIIWSFLNTAMSDLLFGEESYKSKGTRKKASRHYSWNDIIKKLSKEINYGNEFGNFEFFASKDYHIAMAKDVAHGQNVVHVPGKNLLNDFENAND